MRGLYEFGEKSQGSGLRREVTIVNNTPDTSPTGGLDLPHSGDSFPWYGRRCDVSGVLTYLPRL